MVFNVSSTAYQITSPPALPFIIQGTGISNNSGVIQNFVATTDNTGSSGSFQFGIDATAGDSTTFITAAATVSGGLPAIVQFVDEANAGSATIINNGAILSGATGGETDFWNTTKGDRANITNKAGVVSGATGGTTFFTFSASAEEAIITSEGAATNGAAGGKTAFQSRSRATHATLIANGGINGGTGGVIEFTDSSDGGTAQVKVFGDGNLDISAHNPVPVVIGSLEGDGEVLLGPQELSIGANNLSTTFSGVIQDSGSVVKTGTGTLTLSRASIYTGGTTVNAGTLKVGNRRGSATGNGAVAVRAGKLSGDGIIAGATSIGTGSGAGAFLAPAAGGSKATTLTIQALIFKADGLQL
ncbi:MAG: autotransporter-associated beta strand repeat-containing protein [Chthoniobacterales bacterium]|nr:autotransporter-associated beta strand repeat-containing protein [Chthoniobacterales bacterium]